MLDDNDHDDDASRTIFRTFVWRTFDKDDAAAVAAGRRLLREYYLKCPR